MDEQHWYVQSGAVIQGPYSTTEVGRYLLLGRIKRSDRVSRDGEWWEPVTQVPELIPEELLDLDNEYGWQNFVSIRARHDERREDTEQGHPVMLRERRETAAQRAAREIRDEWLAEPPLTVVNRHTSNFLPLSLLAVSLVALITAIYLNSLGGVGY